MITVGHEFAARARQVPVVGRSRQSFGHEWCLFAEFQYMPAAVTSTFCATYQIYKKVKPPPEGAASQWTGVPWVSSVSSDVPVLSSVMLTPATRALDLQLKRNPPLVHALSSVIYNCYRLLLLQHIGEDEALFGAHNRSSITAPSRTPHGIYIPTCHAKS